MPGLCWHCSFLSLNVFFSLDFLDKGFNVYLGIFTYIVLPPFIILGLICIPVGALIKKRRHNRGAPDTRFTKIHIDFTIPQHRNAFCFYHRHDGAVCHDRDRALQSVSHRVGAVLRRDMSRCHDPAIYDLSAFPMPA